MRCWWLSVRQWPSGAAPISVRTTSLDSVVPADLGNFWFRAHLHNWSAIAPRVWNVELGSWFPSVYFFVYFAFELCNISAYAKAGACIHQGLCKVPKNRVIDVVWRKKEGQERENNTARERSQRRSDHELLFDVLLHIKKILCHRLSSQRVGDSIT